MSIVKHETGSTLAIEPQQSEFTTKQVAALTHIGVDKATDGDLQVFFHVCQRTGLDPFARQIYMIGRQVSEKDPRSGEWVKVTKQTIQTGIDGFRLIGRRAADHARHSVSVSAPEWAHEDGSWRPIWRNAWGLPIGARVTIHRNGEPFTAVALFDEYKQTKYGGELTAMWAQRPAGQLAKCAEALAWRMAFPQDLSGIYADEEMGQADNVRPAEQPRSSGLAAALADPSPAPGVGAPVEPPAPPAASSADEGDNLRAASAGEASPYLNPRGALARRMFATLGDVGITAKEARLAFVSEVLGREIKTSSEMTDAEAEAVIAAVDAEPVEAEIVTDGAK